MIKTWLVRIILLLVVTTPITAVAEDISLYVNNSAATGGAPQIMIMFDNSGSMSNTAAVKRSYDPTSRYLGGGSTSNFVDSGGGSSGGSASGDENCSAIGVNAATYPVYPNWPRVFIIWGYAGAGDRMQHNNFVWEATSNTTAEPTNSASSWRKICTIIGGTPAGGSGGSSSLFDDRIYFVTGAVTNTSIIPVPDTEDSGSNPRVFSIDILACSQARTALYGYWRNGGTYKYGDEIARAGENFNSYQLVEGGQGYFIDPVIQYQIDTWQQIDQTTDLTATTIECKRDIDANDSANPTASSTPAGYPVNEQSSSHLAGTNAAYDSNKASFNGVQVSTLYTKNYLAWYHDDDIGTTQRSRLEIARDTISDLILASSSTIEYGLTFFNTNNSSSTNGGRIVNKIEPFPDGVLIDQSAIIQNIENVGADTNTPLCETMTEIYRYFAGLNVNYGDDETSRTPGRDLSAESGGVYISPISGGCRDQVYIIVITDGQPVQDSSANNFVAGLSGADTSQVVDNSYLPVLSDWMFNNDINTNIDGDQTAVTFTIGFGEDAISNAGQILSATATNGGGKYYAATDSAALTTALQNSIIEILQSSATFTAPSIASNNFDRTRSLDAVYYSMFLPSEGPNWRGNLKKLKVNGADIVDSTNNNAVDALGNIKNDAQTFWGATSQCSGLSQCADGNEVTKGGVAEMLAEINISTRKLYSNIGANGGLDLFNQAKLKNTSYGGNDFEAHTGIPVADQNTYIDWATGIDVDDIDKDGSTSDARKDNFGDPLHSKPLVINYGGSASSQDLRIVIGTNSGWLHMFDDDSSADAVTESWAFMPKELLPNIKDLRDNIAGSNKVYGMDGSPVAYIKDIDFDGTIESGEEVYIYTGMRRGGRSYYGLNASSAASPPSLAFHIQGGSGDFAELAQSWSQPVVSFIKHKSHDSSEPVLIFAGGYNGDSDIGSSSAKPGRAIFIVNAKNGELIWKATATGVGSNATTAGFRHAIPAKPTVFDSDGNGYTDRIYVADIGGYVWRIDMPDEDPFDSASPWTVQELAFLGGSGNSARKFFSQPSVVRTFLTEVKEVTVESGVTTEKIITQREVPYDGVLIGSGDRANPNSTSTNDMFFLIQDKEVVTRSFVLADGYSPITLSQLFDFSNNPFAINTASQRQDNLIDLGNKSGWYFDFSGTGEKALSSARTIAGVVYFTSFKPGSSSVVDSCQLSAGEGSLYAIGLHYGTNVYGWQGSNISLGERVPDTPVLYGGEMNGKSQLLLVGVGKGEANSGTVQLKSAAVTPPATCEGNNCVDPCIANPGLCQDELIGYKTKKSFTSIQEGN